MVTGERRGEHRSRRPMSHPPGTTGPAARRAAARPTHGGATALPTTGATFPHVVPKAHGSSPQGYCPSNPQAGSVMVNAS